MIRVNLDRSLFSIIICNCILFCPRNIRLSMHKKGVNKMPDSGNINKLYEYAKKDAADAAAKLNKIKSDLKITFSYANSLLEYVLYPS